MSSTAIVNWPGVLADQLDWHWENALRPRFAGLTDEEYFAEPVPGCWSVRRRGDGVAREVGSGDWIIDFDFPAPEPAPVTTIAWRLSHLIVGVFGMRNASHFGGQPMDYDSYAYPGTAQGALDALNEQVERWIAGVRGLTADALAQPCGEDGHEDDPLAMLVLHINREALHHGAEIALLRDLHQHSPGRLAV